MKTRFQKSQCNPLDIIGSLIDAKFYIETSFWKLTLIQYSGNIVIFSWLVHGRSLFADWGIWSWIIVPNVDFFINRLYFSFQYWNKCEIANFKYRCEKLVRVIGITALLVSPQCQVVSFLAVFPAHRDTTLSSRLGGVSSLSKEGQQQQQQLQILVHRLDQNRLWKGLASAICLTRQWQLLHVHTL